MKGGIWGELVTVLIFIIGVSALVVLVQNPAGTRALFGESARGLSGIIVATQGHNPAAVLQE